MSDLSALLLAANYIIPVAVGVAALVALAAVALFVALAVRRKKKPAQPEQKAETQNEQRTEPQPVQAEPQAVQQVEEKAAEDDTEDADDSAAEPEEEPEEEYEEAPQRSVARINELNINGAVRYIIIKYNKSFTAKLIQSDDEVKSYYSALKNELLSYDGIKTRMSWKGEAFYCGRKTYAKLAVRGKCVCLFLALNANDYAETKYKVDDMSEVAAYEKIPCLYRIKNDRRLKYSADLIATAMDGRKKLDGYTETDYAKQYPYEKIEPLIERKLVKVLTEEDAKSGDVFKPRDAVTVSEAAELMQDEIAVALIEEAAELSDKTKFDIVNIDTLSKNFADGETVTIEEIKKRVSGFSKKATAVKVLARGRLDKKLYVIADSYSIEAAKMILLTGGNAVKKKNA